MTESQKALGQIIVFVNKYRHQKDKEEIAKPIGIIKDLVEKSIPLKPYITVDDEICCPCCNEPIDDDGAMVTSCCIQRLDWSGRD